MDRGEGAGSSVGDEGEERTGKGWVTEADSDARSFFIIFKPPWSNLTLETVPSKSIRGYAFSLSPCPPSSRAISPPPPSFSRDVLPIPRGMKAPANQVDSLCLSLSLSARVNSRI